MKKLLRIDASARLEGSESRNMGDYFQEKWVEKYPDGQVMVRDLIKETVPHISQETITGFYTPEEDLTNDLKDALQLSDQLIEEVIQADEVLVSSPLYNFSVPSALKAYIDHLVRINKTFGMDESGNFYGMIKDTKIFIITAKGAAYKGTQIEPLDMQDPYLKLILPFIGMELGGIVSIEGTTTDPLVLERSKKEAKLQIDLLLG